MEAIKRAQHRPCTFTGAWLQLVRFYGTVDATAKAIGVDPTMLRKWAKGKRSIQWQHLDRVRELMWYAGVAYSDLPA